MTTAEKTILALCEEVDQWKQEANYWKEKYEKEANDRFEESNRHNSQALKDMGNALKFMLAVKDDEHGNLVILNEDRALLAENMNM